MWLNIENAAEARWLFIAAGKARKTKLVRRIAMMLANAKDPETPAIIQKAGDLYERGSDDDIEVDDDAALSKADEHTWVMMWGCVRHEDVGITNEEANQESGGDTKRENVGAGD